MPALQGFYIRRSGILPDKDFKHFCQSIRCCRATLLINKKEELPDDSPSFLFIYGERGIRTLGYFRNIRFQVERIRPLCHLSSFVILKHQYAQHKQKNKGSHGEPLFFACITQTKGLSPLLFQVSRL